MSTNKKNILKSITISLVTLSMLAGLNLVSNIQDSLKVNAAGTNNADLIIGKVDTGSAIELSVCIKNTGDPLHLASASTWFDFDNSKLTPNPTIVQSGIYTTAANGYGPLKFEQVQPAPVSGQTSEKWTVRTDYFGGSVGLPGLLIPTTNNELIGRVKFDKIGAQTNPLISLVNSTYYSTEYATTPITFNIINQNSVCTSSGVAVPAYSFGAFSGTLIGVVGQPFPSFTTTGCQFAYPTNSYNLGISGTNVPGMVSYPGCVFTPTTGSLIPSQFVGISQVTVAYTNIPNLIVSTNFTNPPTASSSSQTNNTAFTFGTYNGVLTGVVGSAFPSFTLIGCNLPNATNPVTLTVNGATVNGNISKTNCVFTPNSGTLITAALTNNATFSLSAPNIPTKTIPSFFTNSAVTVSSSSTTPSSSSNISSSRLSSSSSATPSTGGGTIIITNKPASQVTTINSANVAITKPSITDPLDCLQRITGNATGDSVKISLEFYDLKTGKLSYLFQDLPKSNSGDYLFQLNASDTSNPNYVASGDYKIKYLATDKNNQTASGEYEANIKANAECKKISSENTRVTLPKTGGNTTATETTQPNVAQTNQQQALANIVSSGSTPRSGGLTNIIIALVLFVIPVSLISFFVFRRKDIPFFKTKK